MGCDYYTWIETIIVYKDLSGVTHRFIEKGPNERRYSDNSHIDTDFKALPTISQILNDEIRIYGKQKMFVDNSWLCNYNGKMRICGLCETNDIPFTSLIEVYKQMGGYER